MSSSIAASLRPRDRRGRDLALAPGDESVDRLGDRRVHRRLLVLGEELLPDPVGPFRGGPRAVRLPRLEVAPVGQERPVERRLVALERVGRAEEVAARPDLGDRVDAQRRLVDHDRLEHLGDHLQDLRVDDELLERGGEAALEPAGALVEQVHPAHHRAPHGHLGLVGRLGVDDARRGRVRRPPRQPVAPGELAAGDRALDRLGRAEGRRSGAHVDVRGERPVDHRRPGPDDLGQGDEEQRLGVLLGERAGQRHRAHRAGERERRRDDRLAVERHLDEPVAHRPVEPERRVRVDDRHARSARGRACRGRRRGRGT